MEKEKFLLESESGGQGEKEPINWKMVSKELQWKQKERRERRMQA